MTPSGILVSLLLSLCVQEGWGYFSRYYHRGRWNHRQIETCDTPDKPCVDGTRCNCGVCGSDLACRHYEGYPCVNPYQCASFFCNNSGFCDCLRRGQRCTPEQPCCFGVCTDGTCPVCRRGQDSDNCVPLPEEPLP